MKLIATLVLASSLSSVAHAGYISTTFTEGLNTQIAEATVYTFDQGKPAGYSGAGWTLPTSVPGYAAAPAGDTTPYLSVAFPAASGTETWAATSGERFNYFGLYWGSIDSYNTLTFFDGNTPIATITGNDVIQAGTALGDQVAPGANRYVNFFLNDLWFDRIEFNTTQFAFESDNHAYATVPEPEMLALFGAGALALAYMRRRKGQSKALAGGALT